MGSERGVQHMAEIHHYDPHKAKKMVEHFRKTGKVDIAKKYKDDPDEFITRLNDASGRKYEDDFIRMYRKVAPNHSAIVKQEYTDMVRTLKYPLYHVPDVKTTPVSTKIESALRIAANLVNIQDMEYIPDYEKPVMTYLHHNSDEIITMFKDDVKTVTDFITKWADKTNDPNVYIVYALATELRTALIQFITLMVMVKELTL